MKTNTIDAVDARAARIEKMANAIIHDARKRDAERRRRNELEMAKLKRLLEGGEP